MDFNVESLRGEVNNQNLFGYWSPWDKLNSAPGGTSSSYPLSVNERVEIPSREGVDINYQGGSEGFSSHSKTIQYAPRPRADLNYYKNWVNQIKQKALEGINPPGWAESQPNVSGLGFINGHAYTGPEMRPQPQKLFSGSRIDGILERFERMKREINEWETLTGSQVISLDVVSDWARSLTKTSQDLAKEACWHLTLMQYNVVCA